MLSSATYVQFMKGKAIYFHLDLTLASLKLLQVQNQFIYNVNLLLVLKASFTAHLVVVYMGSC